MTKMRMTLAGAAGLLLVSVATAANAATITTYTDRLLWDAATSGPVFTEDFNDMTLNCTLTILSDAGAIGGGLWNDRVTLVGGETTSFNWSQPVFAAGGTWDLSPAGPGHGLALTVELVVGGQQFAYEIPNSTAGTFVGFTSDAPIEALIVTAGTQPAVAETYSLDGLVYEEGGGPIVIGGNECGVDNFGLGSSCSLAAEVAAAEAFCSFEVNNHGDFVSCMTQKSNALKAAGAISGRQNGALTSCAARSDVGKPDSG